MKFCFGDIVVVEGGLIGVVVKSWGKSFLGKPRNYDVYVRSWNIIQNYDEEDIERYSTDKSKIIGLVEGTGWNEFLELNRMAFDDYLPRNSESRCIAQSIRLIKKQAPHIKWIISFADGCQCGDGTIYRASGFILTGIKPNKSIILFPSGHRIAQITVTAEWNSPQMKEECRLLHVEHKYRPASEYIKLGAKYLSGYQLRYIYFIDKSYRERLTVKELPFDTIDKMNAGMYKGETISLKARREE